MAVTREEVLAAVEKYLPRTVNFAQSADMGERDQDAIFSRVQQIMLTSLLVDPDAAFFVVFLAAQRLLEDVDQVIVQLETLIGEDELRSVVADPPSRIASYEKLQAASTSLVRLSSGVVTDGVFGEAALTEFRANVEGFLTDEILPNVVGGNQARVSRDISSTMAALKTSWQSMLDRRERLFTLLDAYTNEDLRTRVSATIVSAIQVTFQQLLEELPELSTVYQAEQAEALMVDLAAAEAALLIVGGASSPLGTVIAAGADASSERGYLAVEGRGRLELPAPVRTGDDGRLGLQGPGPGGAPLTSITGQTVAPVSGRFTEHLGDLTLPDLAAAGITAGSYITLVDEGSTHTVTAVTPSYVTLSPAVRHKADTPQRYAVTSHAPGELFESPGGAFWTAPGTAATASSLIASGTAGAFPRVDRTLGADGTVIVASGAAAVFRPRKASGATAEQGPLGFPPTPVTRFADASATLLSNQVTPGDRLVILDGANAGTHDIVSVDSETELTSATSFAAAAGGVSWYIEAADAEEWFDDATASFISSGVTTAYTLQVVSAPVNGAGTYSILGVLSQTRLQTSGGPHTYETGATWRIRKTLNNQLRSESVDFYSTGVQVGDLVDIAGEGTFRVTAVEQHVLTFATTIANTSLTGASFTVYAYPGTSTDRFYQGDGVDFEALNVSSVIYVAENTNGAMLPTAKPSILVVGGVRYAVLARDGATPESTLQLLPPAQGLGAFTTATLLVDTTADFVASGVSSGVHDVVLVGGPNAGTTLPVVGVSATTLTVSGAALIGGPDTYIVRPRLSAGPLPWQLYAGDTSRLVTDTSGAAPFTPDSVGWTLVWAPGVSEVRTQVSAYVSSTQVWVTRALPAGETQDYAFIDEIAEGQTLLAAGRSYRVEAVVDGTTLQLDPKMANSAGLAVDYQILRAPEQGLATSLVVDPVGAAAFDPVDGFTSELAGLAVELQTGRPITTTVARPLDLDNDGFFEAFQVAVSLPAGSRDVAYRIRSADANTTDRILLDPGAAAVGDTLTLWDTSGEFQVLATAGSALQVAPRAVAGLSRQAYAVVRGGSRHHGRYVLLEELNSQLDLDETTDGLRLRVAETLIDFGAVALSIGSGGGGTVHADLPGRFSAAVDFFALGTRPGDRLTVTYGGETRRTYVERVLSATQLQVLPEISEGASLPWVLERSSVSSSIEEATRLLRQALNLRDILDSYVIDRNLTVEGVVALLMDQRLDRQLDLLYDGKMAEFLQVDRLQSSYATAARSSIQSVGAGTLPTQSTQAALAGTDPSQTASGYGAPVLTTAGQTLVADTPDAMTADEVLSATSSSAVRGPSRQSSTSTISGGFREQALGEVEVRVALAKAVNDLADDELARSLAFATYAENRNRAIYELSGSIESGVVTDTDATLPWISQTGSIRDRIVAKHEAARAALQYMLDNPDKFDDSETT